MVRPRHCTSLPDYKLRATPGYSSKLFNVLLSLFVRIDNLYSLFYYIIVMVSFSYRII